MRQQFGHYIEGMISNVLVRSPAFSLPPLIPGALLIRADTIELNGLALVPGPLPLHQALALMLILSPAITISKMAGPI